MRIAKRVLLVSMPYGALDRPALGLSLLKPILEAQGMGCDIQYLNFVHAEMIGVANYRWIASELPYTAFAGEWTFAEALYGARPDADAAYVNEVLFGAWRLSGRDVERIVHIRSFAEEFLRRCLAEVPWYEYGIVGFTSTFEQNLASLALARRLKHAFPHIQIVFGGANWEADMGLELHRKFPFVDFVCSGEADESFPKLVHRLLGGAGRPGADSIPGIVERQADRSVYTGPAPLLRNLDALPTPDFSDYFETLVESPAGASAAPTLLVETARGCWWGARSHCTFCGLNGGAMTFRRKSPHRALSEFRSLAERWGIDRIEVVDNIMDMGYFRDVLPELARSGSSLQFFYEVKSNLKREHVRLLREAGVGRIQPGIESLSDHVLTLMRKGTTALRNIQLLKWCRADGVHVDWNILYGFPGETREDYRTTMALLPSIRFLQPPTACGPIRMDRFSPYFNEPAKFGLENVRPMGSYPHLYPFDRASLARIAYYFDFDYDPACDPRGFADEVIAYTRDWIENPERGVLTTLVRPDGRLVLSDTRSIASRRHLILDGPDRLVYEFCDEVQSVSSIVRFLASRCDGAFEADNVTGFLDSLVANHLMVRDREHYLSLALRAPSVPNAPDDVGRESAVSIPAGRGA